jgi:hypothetical protein
MGGAFVAKLDPEGACVWNKQFPGMTGVGRSVAATASGQVVVTGSFSGTGAIDFGSGPVAGLADGNLFVAKLDASGAPAWGKVFGLSGAGIFGQGITVDSAGNVLVTGIAIGSVDFGTGTLTSTGAAGDVFVASFDGSGTLRWARLFGRPAKVGPLGPLMVAADPFCHVLVAGSFEGTLDFGVEPLMSGSSRNVFVAELER